MNSQNNELRAQSAAGVSQNPRAKIKKRKVLAIGLCMIIASLMLSSCVVVNWSGVKSVTARGEPERFEFRLGEYTEIHTEFYCDINYYSAGSDTVTLDIQSNIMEYVVVEVIDGTLIIRSTRTINWANLTTPVLTISTPELTNVDLMGAGTFRAHDTIVTERFYVFLAGAGRIIAELDVDRLDVHLAGAGSADLSGRADDVFLSLSGAGSINALSLQTLNTDISLAGAGYISISSSDSLSITASGAGTVEYRGNPNVNVSRSGVVTIRQVD